VKGAPLEEPADADEPPLSVLTDPEPPWPPAGDELLPAAETAPPDGVVEASPPLPDAGSPVAFEPSSLMLPVQANAKASPQQAASSLEKSSAYGDRFFILLSGNQTTAARKNVVLAML